MDLNKTLNGTPNRVRVEIVGLCNARLIDSIALYTELKSAHWNVKGKEFQMLHELFDDIAGKALGYADTLAERAVQLGGVAEGTIPTLSKTSLSTSPMIDVDSQAIVKKVADALAQYANLCRNSVDYCNSVNDQLTLDIFVEIGRSVEKDLWFVESHLM